MTLRDLLQKAKNEITNIASNVGNGVSRGVNNYIQNKTVFANPTSNNGQNFWSSNAGQNLGKIQSFIESPQKLNIIPTITPFKGNNVASNIGNTIANIPGGMVNTVTQGITSPVMDVGSAIGRTINGRQLDYNQMRGVGRLGMEIGGLINPIAKQQQNTKYGFKQVAGNMAEVANPILTAYVPSGAKNVAGAANASRGVVTNIIKGAKTGAIVGGGYGVMGGLESGREIENNPQYLLNMIENIAGGAALGGVLGGATSGIGGLLNMTKRTPSVEGQLRDKAGRWVAGDKPIKPDKMPQAQWDFQQAFNKKYNRNPYAPVYSSDLQEAVKYEANKNQAGLSVRDINLDKKPLSTSLEPIDAQGKLYDIQQARGTKAAADLGGFNIVGQKNLSVAEKTLQKAGEMPMEIKTPQITKDFIKNYYESKKVPVVGDSFVSPKGDRVEITSVNPRKVFNDATGTFDQALGSEINYQLVGNKKSVEGTIYLDKQPFNSVGNFGNYNSDIVTQSNLLNKTKLGDTSTRDTSYSHTPIIPQPSVSQPGKLYDVKDYIQSGKKSFGKLFYPNEDYPIINYLERKKPRDFGYWSNPQGEMELANFKQQVQGYLKANPKEIPQTSALTGSVSQARLYDTNTKMPEVVYRGTGGQATSQGMTFTGKGSHFAVDKSFADQFADEGGSLAYKIDKSAKIFNFNQIRQEGLNLQQGDIANNKIIKTPQDLIDSYNPDWITKKLKGMGYDGLINDQVRGKEVVVWNNNKISPATSVKSGNWYEESNPNALIPGEPLAWFGNKDVNKANLAIVENDTTGLYDLIDLNGKVIKSAKTIDALKNVAQQPSVSQAGKLYDIKGFSEATGLKGAELQTKWKEFSKFVDNYTGGPKTEAFEAWMKKPNVAQQPKFEDVANARNAGKISIDEANLMSPSGERFLAQRPIGEVNAGKSLTEANTKIQSEPQFQSQQLNPNRKTATLQTTPNQEVSSTTSVPQTSSDYIKELTKKQDEARQGEKLGVGTTVKNFLGKLKTATTELYAPIQDTLSTAEKKGKFKVLPKDDIRLQIDRTLRSKPLATQFIKDNGLVDVIINAPDLNALDQYMIAKQAKAVSANGIETGRNSVKDQQLITDLAPTYEGLAQKVNQYSRNLLQYFVDSGLVSKETADALIKKYPEYVPINRIFNKDELASIYRGNGRGVASLSKQTVVQRLQGSEREIESPIVSLFNKTVTAFEQGERNIAAQQLASYKDLPGNPFDITPVKEGGASGKTTFSALINGKKQTFETTPEVAAAAKNLDKEQINIILKIASYPTRLLRLGATGINYPFAIANLVKDQTTAFINSKNTLYTSIPKAFLRGLWGALSHGKGYEDTVRSAGMGTSFDIGREQTMATIGDIRRSRNLGGKIVNILKTPIRSAEDLIGRTEELTRIQQYEGTYEALIKKGRTPQDARLLAGEAARETTVNFARGGSFTKVMNWLVPYFNAGVQGARTSLRNAQNRPVQTLTKFAIGIGLPVTAVTLWNLSDPKRKAAYADIPEYEKKDSLIIVPDNPTKNDDGTWNVIKIAQSQEISPMAGIIRRSIEAANGQDPVTFREIASAVIQTGTSLDTSSGTAFASSITPQISKPFLETTLNKNLYTGQDIVPDYLKNLPPEEQIKKNTSGTARIIAKSLGVSPLLIQNEAQTMMGGLGPQLLNASDTLLNKAGVIPANQVSTKSFGNALQKRFLIASGGNTYNTTNDQLMKGLTPKETQAYNLIHTPKQVDANGNPVEDNAVLNSVQKATLYLNYPNLQAIDAIKAQQDPNHDPIWDLTQAQRNVILASRVQLPGQKNTYDSYLRQQPWYADFTQKENAYYDSLPVTTSSTESTTGTMKYPEPSDYVQQQMDAGNWKDSQVQAYLQALDTYHNDQLTALGLPTLSNGYSYNSKIAIKKFFNSSSMPKIKITNPKRSTFKISSPKISKSGYRSLSDNIVTTIKKPKKIKLKLS